MPVEEAAGAGAPHWVFPLHGGAAGSSSLVALGPATGPAGPRTHAVAVGVAPPPLYTLMTGRKWPARVAVLTAGADPPLATMLAGALLAYGMWRDVRPACDVLGCCRWHGPRRSRRQPRAACAGAVQARGARKRKLPLHALSCGLVPRCADETPSPGLLSLVSGLAGTAASGLLRRGKGKRGAGPDAGKAEAAGEPLHLGASVWDEARRQVVRLSMSPW